MAATSSENIELSTGDSKSYQDKELELFNFVEDAFAKRYQNLHVPTADSMRHTNISKGDYIECSLVRFQPMRLMWLRFLYQEFINNKDSSRDCLEKVCHYLSVDIAKKRELKNILLASLHYRGYLYRKALAISFAQYDVERRILQLYDATRLGYRHEYTPSSSKFVFSPDRATIGVNFHKSKYYFLVVIPDIGTRITFYQHCKRLSETINEMNTIFGRELLDEFLRDNQELGDRNKQLGLVIDDNARDNLWSTRKNKIFYTFAVLFLLRDYPELLFSSVVALTLKKHYLADISIGSATEVSVAVNHYLGFSFSSSEANLEIILRTLMMIYDKLKYSACKDTRQKFHLLFSSIRSYAKNHGQEDVIKKHQDKLNELPQFALGLMSREELYSNFNHKNPVKTYSPLGVKSADLSDQDLLTFLEAYSNSRNDNLFVGQTEEQYVIPLERLIRLFSNRKLGYERLVTALSRCSNMGHAAVILAHLDKPENATEKELWLVQQGVIQLCYSSYFEYIESFRDRIIDYFNQYPWVISAQRSGKHVGARFISIGLRSELSAYIYDFIEYFRLSFSRLADGADHSHAEHHMDGQSVWHMLVYVYARSSQNIYGDEKGYKSFSTYIGSQWTSALLANIVGHPAYDLGAKIKLVWDVYKNEYLPAESLFQQLILLLRQPVQNDLLFSDLFLMIRNFNIEFSSLYQYIFEHSDHILLLSSLAEHFALYITKVLPRYKYEIGCQKDTIEWIKSILNNVNKEGAFYQKTHDVLRERLNGRTLVVFIYIMFFPESLETLCRVESDCKILIGALRDLRSNGLEISFSNVSPALLKMRDINDDDESLSWPLVQLYSLVVFKYPPYKMLVTCLTKLRKLTPTHPAYNDFQDILYIIIMRISENSPFEKRKKTTAIAFCLGIVFTTLADEEKVKFAKIIIPYILAAEVNNPWFAQLKAQILKAHAFNNPRATAAPIMVKHHSKCIRLARDACLEGVNSRFILRDSPYQDHRLEALPCLPIDLGCGMLMIDDKSLKEDIRKYVANINIDTEKQKTSITNVASHIRNLLRVLIEQRLESYLNQKNGGSKRETLVGNAVKLTLAHENTHQYLTLQFIKAMIEEVSRYPSALSSHERMLTLWKAKDTTMRQKLRYLRIAFDSFLTLSPFLCYEEDILTLKKTFLRYAESNPICATANYINAHRTLLARGALNNKEKAAPYQIQEVLYFLNSQSQVFEPLILAVISEILPRDEIISPVVVRGRSFENLFQRYREEMYKREEVLILVTPENQYFYFKCDDIVDKRLFSDSPRFILGYPNYIYHGLYSSISHILSSKSKRQHKALVESTLELQENHAFISRIYGWQKHKEETPSTSQYQMTRHQLSS